jgi:glycerol-3-phosphate dehydrogenase
VNRPALSDLPTRVDLVIVGGGITGAGIFREAARTGARVLLLEQHDFASGTSSGSSKLVHGGLRYLKSGQWGLTLESVRERQRLLREAPGLVEAQPFMMPIYAGMRPGRLAMRTGLWIYDRMSGTGPGSRWIDAAEAMRLEPHLRSEGLLGAMLYEDARTDDARLVLRLIFEAAGERAVARNYTRVAGLLQSAGEVRGVAVEDAGATREIESAMVVNATGAWAESLSGAEAPRLRPLRGSHFIFPLAKLPVGRAVSWLHPRDHRPIFAYPWQGAALYGTTDLDHGDAGASPRMSADESEYLLTGLAHEFPDLKLTAADAISRYSAVRPVVAGGKADPSAESRESAMWSAPGIVGITGGKLTTFRVTARQVLREVSKQAAALAPQEGPLFGATPPPPDLAWSARHEQVVHLDDLLLRRSRMGLVTPAGGRAQLPQVRASCQTALGWSDATWQQEESRYLELWARQHAPGVSA